MDLKLAGKTAIVTGCSRGLGEAICKDLAKEGADVVINYSASTDNAEKLAETIVRDYDVEAMAVKADISKEDEVKALFEKAAGLTGKIDILVNNAGVCPVIMIKDTPLDVWEQVLKVNMTGVFLTCREMVNYSIENKIASNIINFSSQSAFNGQERWGGVVYDIASERGFQLWYTREQRCTGDDVYGYDGGSA